MLNPHLYTAYFYLLCSQAQQPAKMYLVLILLLATYLVVLATSQTIALENTPTNLDPGVVLLRSDFQILPKRASSKKTPPKGSPLQKECKVIKIKAGPSVSKGHPEQQLLTASCRIPGTDRNQYSELSLDRCLGWHKNNDGSGRLFAMKQYVYYATSVHPYDVVSE
ncbi:hypothetical protein BDV40DRAFT_164253 [Aspergillus tamarii]|uniref:Uncharacterized protein n=1 Tax=Aspergillus tamarii TaxID=41984 RepID=A0A5N6UUA0_ASPTM|nr:hypothetical protein BDV40DRAFT_164253 [Aspergillus tamarii]